MAYVQSIVLRNYRRFRGEVELPLSGGIDIIQVPQGMGKSSIVESVAWCLAGNISWNEVMNLEGRHAGESTMVSLKFYDPHQTVLERIILSSATGLEEDIITYPDGDFNAKREELFPLSCIHSNILSGISLERVAYGDRAGGEVAIEKMGGWDKHDAQLRSSMEATSLFSSMMLDSAITCLMFDEHGKLSVELDGPVVDIEECHAMTLAAAIAFARENCSGIPIFLDEPFEKMNSDIIEQVADAILEFMDGYQLVILLSNKDDVEKVRSSGRVDKELEIKG
ncbi:MAG: hypothetical protein GX369_07675 [Euryarchaeota archaeon]|nr:hypothetical protein [Euryarchaeota archaeon]